MRGTGALALLLLPAFGSPAWGGDGLTAVDGIRVGHHTLSEAHTGCTVILAEAGAVAAVDVRGGAPGTRETDLLDPANTVQKAHAILLSGGSAFGLDAATGVMRYLEEKGVGFDVGIAKVPIVPGAILFDLGASGNPRVHPGADCGYLAAKSASAGPIAEGSVGAGAGATVGKLAGMEHAMKGGVGTSSVRLENGLIVAALVAVNAVGDIVDPANGQIVAGARSADGRFLDARKLLQSGAPSGGRSGENTTIGVVATNANLTQAQATKVARMAQDGLARTLYPSHSPLDGDTLFVLATGSSSEESNLTSVGALAADVVAQAILRAVRQAEGIPGFPSVRDLSETSRPQR